MLRFFRPPPLLLLLLLLGWARATPCAHNETRNPITGLCNCFLGYKGSDCEVQMFPACLTTHDAAVEPHGWPPAMSCRLPWGQSCECMRQCRAERNRFEASDAPCFERAAGDPAPPSQFPTADEAGVSYWSTWKEGRVAVGHAQMTMWERPLLPLSACPSSCSHEGVCLGPTPECVCANGLRGPDCAEVQPSSCFMNCSSRGTCARAVCLCDPGWFGMGCTEPALDEAALAAKRATSFPPRHRLALYVWELPSYLSLLSLMDSDQRSFGLFPGKAASFSEFAFLHTVTEDLTVRVRTPWEANAFLLPTFSIGVAAGFGGDLILGRIKRIIAWMHATPVALPFWERYGGADMIFWTAGDLGACTLNSGGIGGSDFSSHEGPAHEAALQNIIVVSEYGQTDFKQRDPAFPVGYCMRSTKGIVVPPSIGRRQCEGWVETTYAEPQRERKVLMNFYGWIINDRMYSQGVRWAVKELFGNVSDFVISGDKLAGDRYIDSLRDAVFCLAPSGFGYGVRVTYTMLTGCIPVIIQDGVRQPFDDVCVGGGGARVCVACALTLFSTGCRIGSLGCTCPSTTSPTWSASCAPSRRRSCASCATTTTCTTPPSAGTRGRGCPPRRPSPRAPTRRCWTASSSRSTA